MSRVADTQSQGSLQAGTRGAKSAGTLFFYNVFSDVLLNAEASPLVLRWIREGKISEGTSNHRRDCISEAIRLLEELCLLTRRAGALSSRSPIREEKRNAPSVAPERR